MTMTRAEFTDYIVNQCGTITRYVVGEWKKTRSHGSGKSEVYRIDEDGVEYVRNLYISLYGGYFIEPSLREKWCRIEGGCPGLKKGTAMLSLPLTEAERPPSWRPTPNSAGLCRRPGG